jgi:hypothetical protein
MLTQDVAANKLAQAFVLARNSNDRKALFLDIGCRNESVRKAMLTGLRMPRSSSLWNGCHSHLVFQPKCAMS